jgi:TrmH family RNA methyltransferase
VRGGMGASFGLPIVRDVELVEVFEELHTRGFVTVLVDPRAEKSVLELNMMQPIAFVFGNEGHGFKESTVVGVKEKVLIPMQNDTESLNVSISAAITMFEWARQRNNSSH